LEDIELAHPITQRNQLFYVEVIRNIAEFVVYSEKFRKSGGGTTSKGDGRQNYFDILCERNTFDVLSQILSMNNRFVSMQLIQTSSIFLYNIN
jgi:hypothetical protein